MSLAPALADRVVVFDLDDTLYLERDFALSGYRAAAAHGLARGIAGLEAECAALLQAGERSRIFDRALERLAPDADPALVAELVDVYRHHAPTIELRPDARRWFERHPGRPHALISDGGAATQRAKVTALGLDRLVDHVILTGAWGRDYWKPHPRAFEQVEAWSGRSGRHLVYVADNPLKDFVTPRARGWATVQIRRPERVHDVAAPDAAHAAHAVIETLDDLDAALAGLDKAASASG